MSTLKADTIQSTSGGAATLTKQAGIKCAFRTAGTYTGVRTGSVNVSGLTDNGTGDLTISFTNSFTNGTNQSFGTSSGSTAGRIVTFTSVSSGSCDFLCHTDAGADADAQMTSVLTGDLA